MKKFILLFVLISWQSDLIAKSSGGGTVVGNGAGSVENNFQYAYNSLPKIILTCLADPKCVDFKLDETLLKKILTIAKTNLTKIDRLIFLSSKSNPGFFETGINEANRIAKTQLTPNAPIYINTDMLYDINTKIPTLTFPQMIRILIHEIGHQTGVESHAELDILSAKISLFSEMQTSIYRFKIPVTNQDSQEDISFSIMNFELPTKSTILSFNWKNKENYNLTNSLLGTNSCLYESENYSGIELTNGHFAIDNNGMLSFKAWLNLSCYESFSNMTNIYRKNLTISLDAEYKINSFQVE